MDWNKKEISPRQITRKHKNQNHAPSPALMRFFAAIGFTVSGLGILHLGQRLFGINSNIWQTSNWDAKTLLLWVASFGAALIGGLIGAGVGIGIKIKNERTNHVMSVLWHYLANGVLIWSLLVMLCLQKIYGKEGLKLLFDEVGKWHLAIYFFGICLVGCLAIGALLLITGLLKEHSKTGILPCLMLSLPVTLAMGYVQFNLLGIESKLWVFAGTLLSIALHPVSAYMINRDRNQRRQIIE